MTVRTLLASALRLSILPALVAATGCADALSPQLNRSTSLEDVPSYSEEDPMDWADEDQGTGSDDSGSDGGGTDDDGAAVPPEEPGLVSLDPPADSTTHHYRDPIVVTFGGPAVGAVVSLSGPTAYSAEQQVPTEATWNDDYTEVTVQPSEFLLPLSTYTVSLDVGDARINYSFNTSAIGSPLDVGVDLSGRTYALSLQGAEAFAPEGLGALVAQLPASLHWLWQVQSGASSGDLLDVAVAFGEAEAEGLAQDQCAETPPLGGIGIGIVLQGAYFSSAPGDFEILLGAELLVLEQGWVDGDFTSDATELVKVRMRGWLRGSDIAPLLPGGQEVCDWAASSLLAECQTCPSGADDCIWVDLGELGGFEAGLAFTNISASDAAVAGAGDDDDTAEPPGTGDPDSDGDGLSPGDDDNESDDDNDESSEDPCGGPDYDPLACGVGADATSSPSMLVLLCAALGLVLRRRDGSLVR